MGSGGKRKAVSPAAESKNDARPYKQGGGRQHVEDIQPTEISPKAGSGSILKDTTPQLQHGPTRTKFHGKLLGDLLFIEVCAGSARLTKVARDSGFNGVAIDHSNLRSCGVNICIFELEEDSQVQELCSFIEAESESIACIWIAPSCGTASKARERKVPQLKKLGIAEPIPLRSASQPDQLDGLQGLDKLKVEKANLLYDAVEKITRTACNGDVFVGIENPANSHYWNTTPMQNIKTEFGSRFVTFHNCCHGGSRDKLTSVWVNKNWLDQLEARCDKTHLHKSWKVTVSSNSVHFPTSEEAAYPFVLCQRIVECVKTQVIQMGALGSTTLEEQLQQPDAHEAGRIALGALPRGAKIKPLVAEFGHFEAAIAPVQQVDLVDRLLQTFPKGSRVTSRQLWKRGALRVVEKCHFLGESKESNIDDMVELCWIGVPSEPKEFVQRAIKAGHPRGLDIHVDDNMKSVIQMNLVDPPFKLAKKRVEFFKKWTARAVELNPAEDRLKSSMPEHVRQVLGPKRLLLFGEMLSELGYPDDKLIEDIASGFRLSGYMTNSRVFRARAKRPAMSLDTLRKLGRSFNKVNSESLERRQESELEVATWRETESELERGWVFLDDSKETDGKFIGRRFGIRQGAKIRVIDDCTCCGLNMTVGLHEKFKLHSVDFLAALIGCALKLCPDEGRPSLRGRTYDLKSAYKQFAVHPEDRAVLRMGVNVPDRDDFAVIGFNSLPFGAVGSVAGFLRVSQALWFIGYFGLGLLWSAFYDDYTLLSRSELENSSSWSCESLFDLLGMRYATEGHKCLPFSSKFKTLGLELDTSNFSEGQVAVGHTQSRRDELHEYMGTVLKEDLLSSKEAERLRGRMIFFEGYTFGRVANTAVKTIGKFCTGPNVKRKLEPSLRTALQFLQSRVLEGKPLKIERSLHSTWFIYTDGACNQDSKEGSVGGVIYNPQGCCLEFFGEEVPRVVMDDLFSRSNNPIHELELLPVLITAETWGRMFAGSQVIYFIDNESARMAYIRGNGETIRGSKIIQTFVQLEATMQHRVWFGRVPSFSNPADDPSRLDFKEVEILGATQTKTNWERVSRHLEL